MMFIAYALVSNKISKIAAKFFNVPMAIGSQSLQRNNPKTA
jgi:hypothetical protein